MRHAATLVCAIAFAVAPSGAGAQTPEIILNDAIALVVDYPLLERISETVLLGRFRVLPDSYTGAIVPDKGQIRDSAYRAYLAWQAAGVMTVRDVPDTALTGDTAFGWGIFDPDLLHDVGFVVDVALTEAGLPLDLHPGADFFRYREGYIDITDVLADEVVPHPSQALRRMAFTYAASWEDPVRAYREALGEVVEREHKARCLFAYDAPTYTWRILVCDTALDREPYPTQRAWDPTP